MVDTLGPRGDGQFKYGGDPMRRYGDILARAGASSVGRKSRRFGRSKDMTALLSTSVNSALERKIWWRRGSALWRQATTHTH